MYWTMCYWEVMIMTFMGFLRNWLFIRFHHCENLCWNHSGKLSNGYYALCRPVLLWIEEHMPIIYREVERRFLTDISSWRGLALCHGIGIRRSLHPRRDRVSCGSSPGAQPTDNCIGTLPTDNCPDSIPPADVNTSALPPIYFLAPTPPIAVLAPLPHIAVLAPFTLRVPQKSLAVILAQAAHRPIPATHQPLLAAH